MHVDPAEWLVLCRIVERRNRRKWEGGVPECYVVCVLILLVQNLHNAVSEAPWLRERDAAEVCENWFTEESGRAKGSVVAVARLPDQFTIFSVHDKAVVVGSMAADREEDVTG